MEIVAGAVKDSSRGAGEIMILPVFPVDERGEDC